MTARAADTPKISRPQVFQQVVNGFGSSGWAENFLSVYDEQRIAKAEAKRSRKAAQRVHRQNVLVSEAEIERRTEWARRVAETAQDVRERLALGYRWFGGKIGGSFQPAFTFRGLKSDQHPILKLFVTKLRRVNSLDVGWDKAEVFTTPKKLFSLDYPYVSFNAIMRGIIRIDLDSVFDDPCQLYYELAERGLRPNLIVYATDAKGRIVRPHLYWILENSVCFTEKGSVASKKLFQAIHRGLVAKLVDLGADPGGLSNTLKGKNPLSPHWTTEVLAQEPYDMSSLAEGLELSVSAAELRRRMVMTAAPEGVELKSGVVSSNSFFTTLQQFAFSVVEEHKAADSYAEFEAAIVQHANVISTTSAERQARGIAYRVAPHVWAEFDPSKRQTARPRKGIMMDSMDGLTEAERKAMGGRFIAAGRKTTTIAVCVDAFISLRAEGKTPTQEAVAVAGGRDLRTVKRRWKAIQTAVAAKAAAAADQGDRRCIDKKRIAHGSAKADQSSPTLWQSIRTLREAVAAVVASMEVPWPPPGTETASAADAWGDPQTPSDTTAPGDPWDGFGDLPPPPPMASTPLAELAVGTVVECEIPF